MVLCFLYCDLIQGDSFVAMDEDAVGLEVVLVFQVGRWCVHWSYRLYSYDEGVRNFLEKNGVCAVEVPSRILVNRIVDGEVCYVDFGEVVVDFME